MTHRPDLQQRINDLESSLTYLQADYDSLNQAVLENSQLIEQLKRTIDRLTNRVDGVEENLPGPSLEDEKPPHY